MSESLKYVGDLVPGDHVLARGAYREIAHVMTINGAITLMCVDGVSITDWSAARVATIRPADAPSEYAARRTESDAALLAAYNATRGAR